jgi:ribosomal protein L40E
LLGDGKPCAGRHIWLRMCLCEADEMTSRASDERKCVYERLRTKKSLKSIKFQRHVSKENLSRQEPSTIEVSRKP